jgi:hypothetical protein
MGETYSNNYMPIGMPVQHMGLPLFVLLTLQL